MSFCNLLSVFFFFFFFFSSTIWRTGPYFDKRTAGSQHLVQSNWRIWVPNRCGKKTHYTSGWSIDLFLVNFLGWFAEFFHETETKLSHFIIEWNIGQFYPLFCHNRKPQEIVFQIEPANQLIQLRVDLFTSMTWRTDYQSWWRSVRQICNSRFSFIPRCVIKIEFNFIVNNVMSTWSISSYFGQQNHVSKDEGIFW